jgi:dTDP-4-amino-4,6-dideoxygalactose transaminase
MKIPFSPPYIDQAVIDRVCNCLNSGWITSGPLVRDLENRIASDVGVEKCLCVNSWSSGAMLVLKWLGIKEGDEVILPVYTYSATALVVHHCGATPVFVDVQDDFTISADKIAEAISPRTKAIIAVDFGGLMCDYDKIRKVVEKAYSSRSSFIAQSEAQANFGRPVIISDAAHSIGAEYKGSKSGSVADITIFSLHAVKNITTAEGGAICLNLPEGFNQEQVYKEMKLWSLNGQTKDAFSKTNGGGWQYDILFPGLKVNMPDICAAIGLAQLEQYEGQLLPERKRVAERYEAFFKKLEWAITPIIVDENRTSCYHIYALRIKGASEDQRDQMIDLITNEGVSVNVHFIPLPMLTAFRNMGFDIKNYPEAYDLYKNEISLPIYPQLTNEEIDYICDAVAKAYKSIFTND